MKSVIKGTSIESDKPVKKIEIILEKDKGALKENFEQTGGLTDNIPVPEFEKQIYKIDSGFDFKEYFESAENKLKNGFLEGQNIYGVEYLYKRLPLGGTVYQVFKGIDGDFDINFFGEQKFDRVSINQLGLVDKLPKNYDEFKIAITKRTNENKFHDRFFSGYFDIDEGKFKEVGEKAFFWLGDGSYVEVDNKGGMVHSEGNIFLESFPNIACSVWGLKSN